MPDRFPEPDLDPAWSDESDEPTRREELLQIETALWEIWNARHFVDSSYRHAEDEKR